MTLYFFHWKLPGLWKVGITYQNKAWPDCEFAKIVPWLFVKIIHFLHGLLSRSDNILGNQEMCIRKTNVKSILVLCWLYVSTKVIIS